MNQHNAWMSPKLRLWGLLLLAPQFIFVAVFYIVPFFKVLTESFYFVDPFNIQKHFAGLNNIYDVVLDPNYWLSIKITCILMFGVMVITLTLGLLIAHILQTIEHGQKIYKLLLLWPYAVSPAIAAILWRFMMHPHTGWLSDYLQVVHFNYMTSATAALSMVTLIAVWQQLSYNILFCFVALKSIPVSLLEASMLDGAGIWQRFWHIRLPMLKPTLSFLCLMNCLYAAFDTFSLIDILTSGGPGRQTTTILYKIYKDGFLGLDWSAAAIQSFLLMLIVMVIGWGIYIKQEYKRP
jgi:sn-glycerol 3-phosphate transport system permease protein